MSCPDVLARPAISDPGPHLDNEADFIGCFAVQGCDVVWTSNRNKPEKSRQLHIPLYPENCLRKTLISGLLRLIPGMFKTRQRIGQSTTVFKIGAGDGNRTHV